MVAKPMTRARFMTLTEAERANLTELEKWQLFWEPLPGKENTAIERKQPACTSWCDPGVHDEETGCRKVIAQVGYDDGFGGDVLEFAVAAGGRHHDIVLEVDGNEVLRHPDEAKLLELLGGQGIEEQLRISYEVDVVTAEDGKQHMSWCDSGEPDHPMCYRTLYEEDGDGALKLMFFGTPGRSVSLWVGYGAKGMLFDPVKTAIVRQVLSEWAPQIHIWEQTDSPLADEDEVFGRLFLRVMDKLRDGDPMRTSFLAQLPDYMSPEEINELLQGEVELRHKYGIPTPLPTL